MPVAPPYLMFYWPLSVPSFVTLSKPISVSLALVLSFRADLSHGSHSTPFQLHRSCSDTLPGVARPVEGPNIFPELPLGEASERQRIRLPGMLGEGDADTLNKTTRTPCA